MIGSLLATGINLFTSGLEYILHSDILVFTFGILLIIAAIMLLAIRIFGERRISSEIEVVLFLDSETGYFLPVENYEISEEISRTQEAMFMENPAFQAIWDREPPIHRLRKDLQETRHQDFEPKSYGLVREIIEAAILQQLSLHLNSYFIHIRKADDAFIRTYGRDDMPQILLQNRALALLSSPMENRLPFLDMVLGDQEPGGEIVMAMGEGGALYSKLELMLPKGSRFDRPSPSKLVINSPRVSISFYSRYEGYGANAPYDFAKYYLGKDLLEDIVLQKATIELEITLKRFALLRPGGWEFYEWVDSFLNDMVSFGSFDRFLNKINWPQISANIITQMRIREEHGRLPQTSQASLSEVSTPIKGKSAASETTESGESTGDSDVLVL